MFRSCCFPLLPLYSSFGHGGAAADAIDAAAVPLLPAIPSTIPWGRGLWSSSLSARGLPAASGSRERPGLRGVLESPFESESRWRQQTSTTSRSLSSAGSPFISGRRRLLLPLGAVPGHRSDSGSVGARNVLRARQYDLEARFAVRRASAGPAQGQIGRKPASAAPAFHTAWKQVACCAEGNKMPKA